ncbi:hypothetical protein VCHA53O466_50222 [Vibrio chagasii]|nr:hypothetical protein VCHA53O466_50222 [Vibrio chagasii]
MSSAKRTIVLLLDNSTISSKRNINDKQLLQRTCSYKPYTGHISAYRNDKTLDLKPAWWHNNPHKLISEILI